MCYRQHSAVPITMCCFRQTARSDRSWWACLVTAVWACWLTTPAPFISTSTDRTREWPPLTCRSPASLSLMSSVATDRWDWSLISLQTGETDLCYPYRQVRLITGVLTDRWDWSLISLQTGETDLCYPYRQVRLITGVLTDRWDWSLISLQTGETDLWHPYRQVRLTTGVLTDSETCHWGPYRQVRLITGVLTDRWDRCLYTGTQSLIVVPGHCHNAFQKARIARDATVLDNRGCVWCSCCPWVCICRQSAWRVRREWRTVRVVGNSGRYCGTWAVGLTPPLRRSPRVLTAGMLNAAFASESARFLFSSSRQWTTFPSAPSVSTIHRLFASAVTSTSLRSEGRPATDRRRRLCHGPMFTCVYL